MPTLPPTPPCSVPSDSPQSVALSSLRPLTSGAPPRARSPPASSSPHRVKACARCHSSKVQCGAYDQFGACGRCRRKGLECEGPIGAHASDEVKKKRQPKGSVLVKLRSAQTGISSATSLINSAHLGVSLQHSLALVAQSMSDQATGLVGVKFSVEEYAKLGQTEELGLIEAQMSCFVALGARTSSHSAIVGPTPNRYYAPGQARLSAFRALTDRAYDISCQSGLLSALSPATWESYETLALLKFAMMEMVDMHPGFAHVHSTLVQQRRKLLIDPKVQTAVKERIREKEAMSLVLCDAVHVVSVNGERCCFDDDEIERDFGLTPKRFAEDLELVKQVSRAETIEVGAQELFEAGTRLLVCVVRALVELRRQGWQGNVNFSSVAPTLRSVVETLSSMCTCFDQLKLRLDSLRGTSLEPRDMVMWDWSVSFGERKLIAFDMLAWDVTSLLVDNAIERLSKAEDRLVERIELRAAQSIKFLLNEDTGPVLIEDYFHKPSFFGGYFSALPPGLRSIQLAVKAARERTEGGRLEPVGMTIHDLDVFLDGLRITSELMGPAASQADELARGIESLHLSAVSSSNSPPVKIKREDSGWFEGGSEDIQADKAHVMVEGALREIVDG